jgi:hypothetical protein
VTTVESYCSSVRVADAALTDAVNILFSLLPLQSVQLFISDIATTFQWLNVSWTLDKLGAVLLDLDYTANGNADNE